MSIFLYYNTDIKKTVPCTIVPNKIYIKNGFTRICLVNALYNDTDLAAYGLVKDQLLKYGSEYVNIHDLYPTEDQSDVDYYNSCITDGTVDIAKERARYEKIYISLINVPEISIDTMYILCSFVVYDLQFRYLSFDEKMFLRSLSDYVYAVVPTEGQLPIPDPIPVPEFVKMVYNVLHKCPDRIDFHTHIQENYNKIIEFDYVFPVTLNIDNIYNNSKLMCDTVLIPPP